MIRGFSILAAAAVITGAAGSPAAAQVPLKAHYDDDFILETEDGSFQLRIRGTLHFDTRLYQAENPGAVQDMDIRRARIDFMGRLYGWLNFRIQSGLAGSPHLRNAWAEWEVSPGLHLRWGQTKVPFSTSWLTTAGNLNFIERGTTGSVHPFFDRGFLLWGALSPAVSYDLGVFTGAGIDADVSAGDLDSDKEWAARLFVRPFVDHPGPLQGLALAAGATWAGMSVPTDRAEVRGHQAADFGSAIWRWRTEQTLGTDGRVTDRVAAGIDARRRLGAEVHWVRGPLALSTELLEVRYDDVTLYHDLLVGSRRLVHQPLITRSGRVRSWSTWASYYLTGESKTVADDGWHTAHSDAAMGTRAGTVELLARYSRTDSDLDLFDAVGVTGFLPGDPALPTGYAAALPGAGNGLAAAILDGAHAVNEVTLGLTWTANPMVRLQINDVFLWTPDADRNGDGANDNYLLSGAFTGQSDPGLKYRRTAWENAILLRLIVKL